MKETRTLQSSRFRSRLARYDILPTGGWAGDQELGLAAFRRPEETTLAQFSLRSLQQVVSLSEVLCRRSVLACYQVGMRIAHHRFLEGGKLRITHKMHPLPTRSLAVRWGVGGNRSACPLDHWIVTFPIGRSVLLLSGPPWGGAVPNCGA